MLDAQKKHTSRMSIALPLCRILTGILLFVSLTTGGFASAAEKNAEALFHEALICYGEINFSCTLQKLQKAEETALKTEKNERLLVQIYRYMAYAQVALNQNEAAEASFRNILAINPDFTLEPGNVSPKIFRLFLRVKEAFLLEQSGKEPATKEQEKPKRKTPPAPTLDEKEPEEKEKSDKPKENQTGEEKPPETSLEIQGIAGAAVNVVFLTGEDTDYFDVGFALSARAEFTIGKNFHLGGGLWYQRHQGGRRTKNLHLLSATIKPSFQWRIKRVSIHAPLDIGPSIFGQGGIAQEVGLMWRFAPGAYFHLDDSIVLGLHIGPGGVWLPQEGKMSVFVSSGFFIGGVW